MGRSAAPARPPGHQHLDGVGGGVHPGRGGQGGGDLPVEDGRPAQRQPQLLGGRQRQLGGHLQGVEVEVGLVEAVEQHQPVSAGPDQLVGQVGQRAEVGAELDRQRDADALADRADQLDNAPLDLGAVQLGAGGDEVDVQLQGVGAGLLEQGGLLDPAAGGDAVEAGDHRDLQAGPDLLDQHQVAVGAGVVLVEGQRRGQAVRPGLQQPPDLLGLQPELFLEQRRQHHSRRPGRLQPPQPVQAAGQRRGRGDQRAAQVQAQIAGMQVGHDGAP
jgi:hypothetical protein